jgi:hypothetical protein
VITPPYVPIPPTIASVPAVRVELIPTTRLTLNTKDTGEIHEMVNITTITQEDKQASEQIEEVEEPSIEEIQRIKHLVQEKLLKHWHEHDQKLPKKIRISAHNLIPLAANSLVETVFYLKETNIIIEPDPKVGDDIQCDV